VTVYRRNHRLGRFFLADPLDLGLLIGDPLSRAVDLLACRHQLRLGQGPGVVQGQGLQPHRRRLPLQVALKSLQHPLGLVEPAKPLGFKTCFFRLSLDPIQESRHRIRPPLC